MLHPVKKLSDFRWKNRLIITFDLPLDQLRKLDQDQLNDRKLLVFQFVGSELVYTNFEGQIDFLEFLKLKTIHHGQYLLIGLDGGLKDSGDRVGFSAAELLKQVDSMPMRQSEIKKKNNIKI